MDGRNKSLGYVLAYLLSLSRERIFDCNRGHSTVFGIKTEVADTKTYINGEFRIKAIGKTYWVSDRFLKSSHVCFVTRYFKTLRYKHHLNGMK